MEFFAFVPLLFATAGCAGITLAALSVSRLKRGQAIRIERGKPQRGFGPENGWW